MLFKTPIIYLAVQTLKEFNAGFTILFGIVATLFFYVEFHMDWILPFVTAPVLLLLAVSAINFYFKLKFYFSLRHECEAEADSLLNIPPERFTESDKRILAELNQAKDLGQMDIYLTDSTICVFKRCAEEFEDDFCLQHPGIKQFNNACMIMTILITLILIFSRIL